MKLWLAYMDIEFVDLLLFGVLLLLIILSVYIMMKKDVFIGIGQLFLTLFTPYSLLVFTNAHKPFWQIEQKRWVSMFMPYDYTTGNEFTGLFILVLVPLFVIMTFKSIKLVCKKESF